MSESKVLEQIPAVDHSPAFLRPIARPDLVIEAQNETKEYIKSVLKDGQDYGVIPGTDRSTLFKAGAESVLAGFGCIAMHEIVESEIDHDRQNTYINRYKEVCKSEGLYRYVVRTKIIHRASGEVVGSGMGSCSTMESKYIWKPRDAENTALKMAQKRALVDAVLSTFGLSDRFTQDVDDVDTSAPDPEQEAKDKAVAYAKKLGIGPEEMGRLKEACKARGKKSYVYLNDHEEYGTTDKADVWRELGDLDEEEVKEAAAIATGKPAEPHAEHTAAVEEDDPFKDEVENKNVEPTIHGHGGVSDAIGKKEEGPLFKVQPVPEHPHVAEMNDTEAQSLYNSIAKELGLPDSQIQATLVASVWKNWLGQTIPQEGTSDWRTLANAAVAMKAGTLEIPKAWKKWMGEKKDGAK
jgi:hypothetical protein